MVRTLIIALSLQLLLLFKQCKVRFGRRCVRVIINCCVCVRPSASVLVLVAAITALFP